MRRRSGAIDPPSKVLLWETLTSTLSPSRTLFRTLPPKLSADLVLVCLPPRQVGLSGIPAD